MNIQVISTKVPNLNSGSQVRDYYLLKGLCRNNKITLAVFTKSVNKLKKAKDNKISGIKTIYFKYKNNWIIPRVLDYLHHKIPELENMKRNTDQYRLTKLHKSTKITIFSQLDSYFLSYHVYDRLHGIKILDAHDIEYIKFKADIENRSCLHKILAKPILSKFKDEEIRAIKKFEHIIVCSKNDKEYYSHYISPSKISIVPNGVDCRYFKFHKSYKKGVVVFVGWLAYIPNIEGIKYYLNNVHQTMLAANKHYKLYIIGSNPPRWLIKRSVIDKSIVVTGHVKDVRKYINIAQVCICPVNYGSGTRLKILEYMASGKPIVSTSAGSEGIEVIDGKNIIIANDANSFSSSIIRVMCDDLFASRLGKNARRLVIKKYDWKTIQFFLNHLIDRLE